MNPGIRLVAAAVLTAGLAACGSAPKEKFYSLAGDGTTATLPSLDRPQIQATMKGLAYKLQTCAQHVPSRKGIGIRSASPSGRRSIVIGSCENSCLGYVSD